MRPLDNITVLDLSHAVAGPHCTYHLGLMGADIIKVERPVLGDDLRHYTEHAGLKTLSAPFIAYNTGKRSITLDLTKPAAREILARLIPRADVMVENFRPGVAKRLGLD
jgi:crotonobetainyl-CoA:carnitine CoA-transferase CaiB-like acyl-CoA transferase